MSQINRVEIQFVESGTGRVVSGLRGISEGARRAGRDVEYLRRALQALGGAFAVKQIFDEVDAYTNLQNRLRIVTRDQEELVTVQQRLFEVSQRTRTDIELNANLFSRLATSTVEAKLSYQELLDITETLNKAIQIGGATTQEASAGLIQLSQGLASGALRADELRAVIEQLPGVADLIAKQLGVSRAALRTLGAEGKITTAVMITAFQKARQEVGDKFTKILVSPRAALTLLTNSFTNFFGKIAGAIGVTDGFASAIQSVSGFIDLLADGLSGLILILQQDEVLVAALGTAFRLLAVVLTVLITIAVIEFFYGIAAGMIAAVAASTPLLIALGSLLVLLTAVVGFKVGEWLYENTQGVRDFGDALAAAVQQAANWFAWLGKTIYAYMKNAFVEITNLMYSIFVEPILDALIAIAAGFEKLTGVDVGASGLKGFKAKINRFLTPVDLEGELKKIDEEYEAWAQEIGATFNAAQEESVKDFANGAAKDWRTLLGEFFGDFNKEFDALLGAGGGSIEEMLKRWADEADKLGLRVKANNDVMSKTPNVVGTAADAMDEYTKAQKKAIESIEEFTADLRFEIEMIGKSSIERQTATNLKKLDELMTKALVDAGLDYVEVLGLELEAMAAIEDLRAKQKRQEELDKQRELDESMKETTDDLRLQIKALQDFSRSADSARSILEFTATANERFGEGTAEAKDAIAEFTALLDQTEQLETYRDLVEEISSNIAQSFEDVIFGAKSVEDAIEDMVKNVAQMVFNQLVTQQIAGFFTSIIGAGFVGGFGGGRGFAMGGVIDRPTFLGMADGMPAYGGESGPEAVVPLPDGRQIPVMLRGGDGGGGQQNITNINMTVKTPDADSFRRSIRQISDDLQLQLRRRR
jgi:tape measure domain-containing protein